jgi:hypothetical protein
MRSFAVVLALLLSAVPARADDFDKLVRRGDIARAAGKLSDAVRAYDEALAIRDDVAVEGRLGLVLFEAGEHAEAARFLLHAMVAAGAPAAETSQFHWAFAQVRPRVCYVEVFVSELGAAVTVDGKAEAASSEGRFFVFVTPGRHEFHARRDGFADAIEEFEAAAGGSGSVRLVMSPNGAPDEVSVRVPERSGKAAPATCERCPTEPKASSAKKKPYPRWSVGAGAVVVFGAASPVSLPSKGVSVSTSVQLNEFFSLQLDARMAWSPYLVEGTNIRGVYEALVPAACFGRRGFFLCPLAYSLGWIHYVVDGGSPIPRAFRSGQVLKLGGELPLPGIPLTARVTADLSILQNEFALRIGRGSETTWAWSGVAAALGATLLYPF